MNSRPGQLPAFILRRKVPVIPSSGNPIRVMLVTAEEPDSSLPFPLGAVRALGLVSYLLRPGVDYYLAES